MDSLEPPDTMYLSAAIGWMELGNCAEARAELAAVSARHGKHPDVLEVAWLIDAEDKQWEQALQTARALLAAAPERSSGWLHQAYALRRVPAGSVQSAWDALMPAVEKFPKEPTIPYNLACYACQMKQLELAREWLRRAMGIGDETHIKEMALGDPDLRPLWKEIRRL